MSNIDRSDSERIAVLESRIERLEQALATVFAMAKKHPLVSKVIDLTKIEL
jgi:hypothetical protein